MKKLLLMVAAFMAVTCAFAQTPAPITGSAFVCLGANTTLSDATPSGSWSSSDPSVAIINPGTGLVTGISLGTATITYTVGTSFATTDIAVKPIPTLTPSSIHGCVNSSYTLKASPTGGGWMSTNTAVATVNFAGVVTGVAPGIANIVYTAAGGCSVTAGVTINALPAPITGTNFVYSGLTTSLSDITPGGTWSSGNPALATVGGGTGIVTGVSSGLVLISYSLPTTCASIYRVEVNPLPAIPSVYAWYPFCGDTVDHSGNGRDLINHGIVTVPATLTTDRFLNPNNAYAFNGVNSMMNYSTFFPNSGTPNDFTYSCWIKANTNQSSIIWYNGDPGANGFGLVMNDGNLGVPGNVVSVLFGASGIMNGGFPGQSISLGVWHNVVLVKSGGVYHCYIDNGPGVFFIEVSSPVFTDVFALGLNYHSTLPGFGPIRDAFDGDIDDVVYITRQLTAPERLSLYNYNPDAIPFRLGNDTTICADAIDLKPNPQTLGGLYTWSKYNGLSYVTFDTTDTLVTVYPNIGPFGNSYALTISKPYGCSASDTITVYKAPIPVNLGTDLNVCIGDTITLTDAFPNASFLWSTGDTAHAIKVTKTGTYYVTVDSNYIFTGPGGIDTAVCIGRDTINVNFHRVPIVDLPVSDRNCQGQPDTVITHFDSGYTYLWSNGTTDDTMITATSGTYWLVVNDSGCVRTDTMSILIVYDTFSFYRPDTAICKGFAFGIRPDNVTFNSIVGYQWTPTAGIPISNTPYPVITADTSAWYYLTVTYPGCPDLVDSFYLDVQPNPTIYMGGNRDVCYGDTIHIDATVDPAWYQHYIYNWSPSTGLDYSTRSNVVFTANTVTDTTTIKFYVAVRTPAWRPGVIGCASLDSGLITVRPVKFDSGLLPVSLCPGDSVQLMPYINQHGTDRGVVISKYRWSPGLYLDDSTSPAPWVHPITTQDYRMIAYSQYGCRDTLNVNVTVHPAAVVDMPDSVVIFPGESYQISPHTNALYFDWYPPLELDNHRVSNPTATPSVSTMYIVDAMTEAGCKITDTIRIHIDPNSLIGIPNAFTPGAGVNNRFMVMKRGLVSLNYLRIYDRWGVMVYETKDINEGWDGTYKAKPQPFGVYVYELEAAASNGKVFKRQGNVTLLR